MRDSGDLRDLYSDLYEPGDEDLDAVVGVLHRSFRAASPPGRLRSSIAEAARARQQRGGWLPPLPGAQAQRLVPALFALLAVIVLGGATVAALPALERALTMNRGTKRIVLDDLGRKVSVTRPIGGYRITVGRVYADPNEIIIGYTVAAPRGAHVNSIDPFGELGRKNGATVETAPLLLDPRGREIPHGGYSWSSGVQNGEAGFVEEYDAAGLRDTRTPLQVQFLIGGLYVVQQTTGSQVQAHGKLACGPDTSPLRCVTLERRVVFDLSIPVTRGARIPPERVKVEGSGSVSVVHAVTAPTGTRVTLRGVSPRSRVRLIVGGEAVELHPDRAENRQAATPGARDYVTSRSFLDKRRGWAVVVSPLAR